MDARSGIVSLADVKTQDDFDGFYQANHLDTIAKKIAFLTQALGIIATRCEKEETPEEDLLGLEEYALLHPWHCR